MHARGQYRYYTAMPGVPPHISEKCWNNSEMVHMRRIAAVPVHFLN
jgi:hypothetical protein